MGAGGSQAALGLSAAAIWGAADFSGGLAAKRVNSALVVALAHGFSLFALFVAGLLLHSSFRFGPDALLSGVFCGGGLIALYSALSRGAMGLSAAVSGVLTALVPVVFSQFREGHASPIHLTGFAVAALSIWLIAYVPDRDSEKNPVGQSPRRGLGLAVLAGLSFGVMLVYMDLAATHGVIGALVGMRLTSTSVAGLAVLYKIAGERGSKIIGNGFPAILPLILLAGVLDTTGNLFYLIASSAGRLDVAAVLSSLYPAGTILLASWLLKEATSRSQKAGMILALGAILLISV